MTGPEHYKHAQNWVFKAEHDGARGPAETTESCAAIAQVHAVLALTAAYAADAIYRRDDRAAWDAATGHATTEVTR